MNADRIAELLEPFLISTAITPAAASPDAQLHRSRGDACLPPAGDSKPVSSSQEATIGPRLQLTPAQLSQISIYIDILLRWNARINLTAVRDPEHIVTRHFGESLFTACHLFPHPSAAGMETAPARKSIVEDTITKEPTTKEPIIKETKMKDASPAQPPVERKGPTPHPVPGAAVSPHRATLVDVGSGAGFPGLPIKIWASHLRVTLIESNQKKATFLREIIRALTLTDIDVFPGRSEDYLRAAFPQPRPGQDSSTMPADTAPHAPARADFVTLRAVERFESALPEAAKLVRPGGCLATLIGESQIARAIALVPAFAWRAPVPIPLSTSRALLVGSSPTCPSAPPSFPRNHSR